MHIVQDQIWLGQVNRSGVSLNPQYIVIQESEGFSAVALGRYLNEGTPLSWHFSVDDREVRQHLPLNEMASDGHAGIVVTIANAKSRKKAEQNAVELVAWLLEELDLPARAIRYLANCPQLEMGWDGFVQAVERMQPDGEEQDPTAEIEALRQSGLITKHYNANALPNWGELATVLNRLAKRLE